eukprot:12570202-Alexandrium_andersonii.AAC.1
MSSQPSRTSLRDVPGVARSSTLLPAHSAKLGGGGAPGAKAVKLSTGFLSLSAPGAVKPCLSAAAEHVLNLGGS